MISGWIGIDPGATGAIARILSDGRIDIFDWPGDERALADLLFRLTLDGGIQSAVIEGQQAFPGQGVVSIFKIGLNYGMWLGAIASQGWPLRVIRPADWKKGLGYPAKEKSKKGASKKEAAIRKAASKEYSLTLARRLYPAAAKLLARKMDHGRAEALLLAHIAKGGYDVRRPEGV